MLPLERQHRIKALIQEKKSMKIAELSALLGVSEMTVHRDLKPMIDEKLVMKTFGGVTLVNAYTNQPANFEACVFCSRNANERLAYRLILSDNKNEITCCAHCGLLRHRQLGDEVIQAICPDFFMQTTISAPLAWYVMDTSIQIGCCTPQVLPFECKEHADNFVKGFGGKVYTFNEAIEVIYQKMKGHDQGCSKHH
ncbi:DeoR/GlpR transcriptional regulator [Virgibacillus sp. NKC19-3]|uniref:DeoR family transcriptional regulator n=1 Tax=Virgibacillus saliphilus TaxID=2831674 RepID=UPI001C9A35EF|nr:DeoR family transcriptional regulator [Virgibacillus sp. NKC19-3]MBY7145066.1 DeoR/GlpR transcriptional regulator [Virgibacillus sp. NKC19-3]